MSDDTIIPRPLSITVIGCLYIVAGVMDPAAHFDRFSLAHPFQSDLAWIVIIGIVAIVAGIFMLRGKDWARWLALAWIVFHVVLSAFGPRAQLAVHALFLIVLAYFLFRRPARMYFARAAV